MSDLPHWIYVLRPVRVEMVAEPTEEEGAVLEAHMGFLEALSELGNVVVYGRTDTTDENTFGIVVFKAPDENAARTVMEADPAVRHAIMTAELFPYRLVYPQG